MTSSGPATRWIDHLSEEDLAFLKRFVLLSGSLKDTAAAYEISYPTVRLRLDRLIEKIKVIEAHDSGDAFELTLRLLFAEGRLDEPSFKALLDAHRSVVGRSP